MNDNGQSAPDGKVWVCLACGKRASNRYDGGIDRGWDASCMLNAQLFDSAEVVVENGRVVKVGAA